MYLVSGFRVWGGFPRLAKSARRGATAFLYLSYRCFLFDSDVDIHLQILGVGRALVVDFEI